MGSFYVNLAVPADATEAFTQLVRKAGDKGLVSPMQQGWMVLVSEQLDYQDQGAINYYGQGLSASLGVPVLSVLNHDDDVLSVDVFKAGQMVAGYNSCPGLFKEHPTAEDMAPRLRGADHLAALREGVTVAQVEAILKGDAGIATMVHMALAELLKLPPCSVAVGYRYASQGEGGVTWKDIA